ncbi:MAG TPA: hypothetical protein VGZ23_00675 [bacterium]|nr:hypothetical protein [bacterium]
MPPRHRAETALLGYLSHHPDAEHDVAWLLEQLAERGARIGGLEARLQRNEWAFSLP